MKATTFALSQGNSIRFDLLQLAAYSSKGLADPGSARQPHEGRPPGDAAGEAGAPLPASFNRRPARPNQWNSPL
jgi:hypothetical protein